MDRPVFRLREWDSVELAYGTPTDADLAVATALGRDSVNRLQLDWLHDGTLRVRSRASVGVVRLEQAELHVVPKLAGGNLGVLQMVDYASGLDALHRFPGVRDLDVGSAGLVDLVCLLLVEASALVLRQGLLRDYTVHEDAVTTLRGRLLVNEQVRRRYGQVDVLECRFDEHEADVPENQLLLAALEIARRVVDADSLRARATSLAIAFAEVCQPATIQARKAARQMVYHRRNAYYRGAHHWALLLLERLGINDLYATGLGQSFVFLIDMNRLFERFVTRLLTDTLMPHGVHVLPQHRTPSIIVDEDLSTTYARVIPDLLLKLPTGQHVPADVKYKRYDDRRVDPSDVYQAFMYAFAYADPSKDLPASLIFYPGAAGSVGFRLAIQNTSGLRGARITGRAIEIQQALQRRGDISGAKDGKLLLDPDDPLAAMVRTITDAG
jgi:5-methylcytosine-specific restriction enzyme subunit McrC